jgi:hypothetical protein
MNTNMELVTVTKDHVDSINAKHTQLMLAGRTMMEKMIELGGDLYEVRRNLPYGKWESWAEHNLKFDIRTAQRYIAAFEKRHELQDNPDIDVQKFLRNINGHANTTTKKRRTASPLTKSDPRPVQLPAGPAGTPIAESELISKCKNPEMMQMALSALGNPQIIDITPSVKGPIKTAVTAPKALKTYKVTLHVVAIVERLIDADSPDQAIEQARHMDDDQGEELFGLYFDLCSKPCHDGWISGGQMFYEADEQPEAEEWEG